MTKKIWTLIETQHGIVCEPGVDLVEAEFATEALARRAWADRVADLLAEGKFTNEPNFHVAGNVRLHGSAGGPSATAVLVEDGETLVTCRVWVEALDDTDCADDDDDDF